MKTAYICAPYQSDSPEGVKQNVEYALKIGRKAIDNGYAPIVPHAYLSNFFDDNNPEERKRCIQVGVNIASCCETIIVGVDHGITEGMKAEIKEAESIGIPIVEYTIDD